MGVSVAPVSDFGGLDLVSSPDSSGCIDLLNVDFGKRGALRSRDGLSKFNAVANASDFVDAQVWERPVDGAIVITADSTHLRAYSSGGVVANDSAGTNTFLSIATLGTAAAGPYCYINGTGLRRFDGTNFTAPAGLAGVTAQFLAVQAPSNRLVAAWTGTSERSRVKFSNALDPETFTAGDHVDLTPNDGEEITGAASYKGHLYVFKHNRYAFFYGNSVNPTGGTDFNYTMVDGVGAEIGAVATGPDGVYFVSRDGIYVAEGTSRRKISGPLEPLFVEGLGSDTFFQAATRVRRPSLYGTARPIVWGTRVMFPVWTASTTTLILVYHTDTGRWSVWDFNSAFAQASDYDALRPVGILPGTTTTLPASLWVHRSSDAHIYKSDTTVATDNGTVFESRYRTGFSDLGYPGREKDIDGTRLWGTGTVAVSGSRDFGSLDTASNVTLGTSPAVAAGLHNKQKLGETVSYKFASVSGGAWALHRYAHYLRDFTPPDERTA